MCCYEVQFLRCNVGVRKAKSDMAFNLLLRDEDREKEETLCGIDRGFNRSLEIACIGRERGVRQVKIVRADS